MDDPVASVTVCEDGPLLLRGPFTLLTQDRRGHVPRQLADLTVRP